MRRIHWISLPLAMSLLLGCQNDKIQDLTPQRQQIQHQLDSLETPKDGEIRLDFTADIAPLQTTEGRTLNFLVIDRTKHRNLQPQKLENGLDRYAKEVAPQLELTIGETCPVYLIFVKEKNSESDAPVTFRTTQDFQVVANEDGQPTLFYKGNLNIPRTTVNGKTLEQHFQPGNKWYVMALLNYTDANSSAINGGVWIGRNRGENPENPLAPQRMTSGVGVIDISQSTSYDGGKITMTGIPFATQWHELQMDIRQDNKGQKFSAGKAMQLTFQPQGALLQFQIHNSTQAYVDIRRMGLISNVLDFSGYYDCKPSAIYENFSNRDKTTGIGMPKWVADTPSDGGYELYWMTAGANRASHGERFFPWNMPQLSDNYTPTVNTDGDAKKITLPNASIKVISQPTLASTRGLKENSFLQAYNSNDWVFTSGKQQTAALGQPVGQLGPVCWIWAMPRQGVTGQPYTYFFASAYSSYKGDQGTGGDVYNPGENFDPQKRLNPQSSSYKVDSAKYYGSYLPAAIRQTSERTQPLIVLYQTDQLFSSKHVYHAQTLLEADLLISEVVYYTQNGENYSAVEIYNPMGMFADLKDYALVRLKPSSGQYLAYRTKDGGTTDDLNEAQILPLQAVKDADIDPFQGTAFSAWATKTTLTKDKNRHIVYDGGLSDKELNEEGIRIGNNVSVSSGRVRGKQHTKLLSAPLWPKQTIVLGASGYVNKPIGTPVTYTVTYANTQSISKIVRRTNYPTQPKHDDGTEREINEASLKAFVGYADGAKATNMQAYGEGVLDYKPGQAFALIKSNGKGGWQIVDATGPIGEKGIAFSGSYTQYQAEFNKYQGATLFSMGRAAAISYPFLYPFRTKRMLPNRWCDDWTIEKDAHSLGMCFKARWSLGDYKRRTGPWDYGSTNVDAANIISRTPLDDTYTYYKQHIPAITRD